MPLVLQPLKKRVDIDQKTVETLSRKLRCTQLFAEVLYNRGYDTPEKCQTFLNPDDSAFGDPFLLLHMSEAVDRIWEAIENKEKITIYGDYDVDGVCSVALLYQVLQELSASAEYYIPDRHTEGYGLNIGAVESIANHGTNLLITVDCGISAVQEVAHAEELGMEVLVTDHHALPAVLPDCLILNPLLPDDAYPFKQFCGAGVALKLAHALLGKTGAMKYLDYAAIATVADIVPLIGENRAIVKLGLAQINQTPREGIKELMLSSGLEPGKLTSTQVAFMLAPRLNAAGRLKSALDSLQVLLSDGDDLALKAAELSLQNSQRQETEQQILQEAIAIAEEQALIRSYKIFIIAKEDWEDGVIGICASRMVERYKRPCILFSIKDGMAKGSGRSVHGINLFEMLSAFSYLFERFGGHEMAAGISMKAELLPELQEYLDTYIRENYDDKLLLPVAGYDAKAQLGEINELLCKNMELLQPTGYKNPMPVFRVDDVTLSNLRTIGKANSHLKFSVASQTGRLDGIAFRYMQQPTDYFHAEKLTLIGAPELNEWKGEFSVSFKVNSAKELHDLDTVKAKIQQLQEDCIRGYYSQLSFRTNGEAPLNTAVFIDDAEEFTAAMLETLENDIAGTLILAAHPQYAQQIASILLGASPRTDISFFQPADNVNGYNCMVIAPSFESLDLRLYKNIIIGDAFHPACIAWLTEQAPWAEVTVFDISAATAFDGIEPRFRDFSRGRLALAYRALKEIHDSRPFASRKELIDFVSSVSKEISKPLLEVALTIFYELGFFVIDTEDGFSCKIAENVKPSKLENSDTYRLLQAYIQ